MKKMKKKFLCIIMAVLMAFGIAGCGAQNKENGGGEAEESSVGEKPDPETATKGEMLAYIFRSEASEGTAMEDIVNDLAAQSGYDCGVIECEEGYLSGFSDEVRGFKSALMFSPYIGTIPFVGYVFETDEPEKLKETLTLLADPRWNICTEADETVSDVWENYVFFVMCPGKDF